MKKTKFKKKQQTRRKRPSRPRANKPGRNRRLAPVGKLLDRLRASAVRLEDHAQELAGFFEQLQADAAGREKRRLIQGLVESGVLNYMQGLCEAMARHSQAEMPQSLWSLRTGPAELLEVLRLQFGLVAMHSPGEILTLDERDLSQVQLVGEPDATPRFPVEVRVVASGWKLDGMVLARPLVEFVTPGSPSNAAVAASIESESGH